VAPPVFFFHVLHEALFKPLRKWPEVRRKFLFNMTFSQRSPLSPSGVVVESVVNPPFFTRV